MWSSKMLNFSVKKIYNQKKQKQVIDLLENYQDLTFKQISEMTGVGLQKVYEINNALERERRFKEWKQREEEKAERVLAAIHARMDKNR